jgi:hypothetical protein
MLSMAISVPKPLTCSPIHGSLGFPFSTLPISYPSFLQSVISLCVSCGTRVQSKVESTFVA